MVVLYSKDGHAVISMRLEEYKNPLALLRTLQGHPDGQKLLESLILALAYEREKR